MGADARGHHLGLVSDRKSAQSRRHHHAIGLGASAASRGATGGLKRIAILPRKKAISFSRKAPLLQGYWLIVAIIDVVCFGTVTSDKQSMQRKADTQTPARPGSMRGDPVMRVHSFELPPNAECVRTKKLQRHRAQSPRAPSWGNCMRNGTARDPMPAETASVPALARYVRHFGKSC